MQFFSCAQPLAGLDSKDIPTPALCLDADRLERNIARMAEFFSHTDAVLRPHVKTHRSPLIARKQIEAGATGITCAKLSEAEVMIHGGITDILIANQVVGRTKINRLAGLARHASVTVAVDNADNVAQLATAASAFGSRVGVLIEVNVGLDRCGVNGKKEALDLAHMIIQQQDLHLAGLMGYEGHAMFIRNRAHRRQICTAALDRLMEMRDALVKEGIDISVISAGGTGTYDVTGRYPGITEVQAGSYATMDATYQATVPEFEPALSVRATVISHPTSDRYVVDAGLKSVSNDMGPPHLLEHPGLQVGLLCEEHLCLSAHGTAPSLQVGDHVMLHPTHGCTTINLYDFYCVIRAHVVEAVWPVAARGTCQ